VVLGAFTILSGLMFRSLRPTDGSNVSHYVGDVEPAERPTLAR
jgi:hypothetical protein